MATMDLPVVTDAELDDCYMVTIMDDPDYQEWLQEDQVDFLNDEDYFDHEVEMISESDRKELALLEAAENSPTGQLQRLEEKGSWLLRRVERNEPIESDDDELVDWMSLMHTISMFKLEQLDSSEQNRFGECVHRVVMGIPSARDLEKLPDNALAASVA